MRTDFVVTLLSLLCSMAMAVVVFGQHQQWIYMTQKTVEQSRQMENINAALEDRRFLKDLVQKQMDERKKLLVDLESELANLAQEEQKKKADNNVCQAEKKTKNEQLEAKQKEKTNTEATLKTESDAWSSEADTLKKQLEQPSEVCAFVKDEAMARKLCGKEEPAVAAVKPAVAAVKPAVAAVKPAVAAVKPAVVTAKPAVAAAKTK